MPSKRNLKIIPLLLATINPTVQKVLFISNDYPSNLLKHVLSLDFILNRWFLQVVMIHDRDLKTFETGAAGGRRQPRLELMKSQRRKNRIRQKAEMGSGNRIFLYPAITKLYTQLN